MENSLDRENLRAVILDFPNQFEKGFEIAKDVKAEGSFSSVTLSGMGGSNIPGDILRTYLELEGENKLEIYQNRSYTLPPEAFRNSLNFFLSFSGNTEETIASLEEAIKNKLPSVSFTAGGKIAEISRANDIPCVILTNGIQPRCATGYFFASMIQVLVNSGMLDINTSEILRSAQKLKDLNIELEGKGMEVAKDLAGKTPIVYTTDKYKALAMFVKIKINENSKTPAFWNYYPELNHNEMVGYTLPQGKFHFLTFIDEAEHQQNIKRMKITADLFEKKGLGTTFCEIRGDDVFEKIFSTLLLGDWISYYLALEYDQDPTPVGMVEDFKELL